MRCLPERHSSKERQSAAGGGGGTAFARESQQQGGGVAHPSRSNCSAIAGDTTRRPSQRGAPCSAQSKGCSINGVDACGASVRLCAAAAPASRDGRDVGAGASGMSTGAPLWWVRVPATTCCASTRWRRSARRDAIGAESLGLSSCHAPVGFCGGNTASAQRRDAPSCQHRHDFVRVTETASDIAPKPCTLLAMAAGGTTCARDQVSWLTG
jgi:hypothetical protein